MDAMSMVALKGKISDTDLPMASNMVQNAGGFNSQNVQYAISTFKNPIMGLVFSIVFGMLAVDRFYKGDIGLGLVKLTTPFVLFVLFSAIEPSLSITVLFIGFIWQVTDTFLVFKGIKKDNFDKLARSINIMPHTNTQNNNQTTATTEQSTNNTQQTTTEQNETNKTQTNEQNDEAVKQNSQENEQNTIKEPNLQSQESQTQSNQDLKS